MKRNSSDFKPAHSALSYIRESKFYIFAAVILFFISALFSFLFPYLFSAFDELLKDIVRQTEGLNGFQLFVFIFKNNLLSALLALFLGIFFGIVPFFNALLNGAVLGYVAEKSIFIGGLSILWRLAPHGIFELPAIFIAIGLGIKLGFSFFVFPVRKTLAHRFEASLRVFVFFVIPLLFIAAVIESLLIYFF